MIETRDTTQTADEMFLADLEQGKLAAARAEATRRWNAFSEELTRAYAEGREPDPSFSEAHEAAERKVVEFQMIRDALAQKIKAAKAAKLAEAEEEKRAVHQGHLTEMQTAARALDTWLSHGEQLTQVFAKASEKVFETGDSDTRQALATAGQNFRCYVLHKCRAISSCRTGTGHIVEAKPFSELLPKPERG